jgi:DNA-binding NarL/FixJ family response regulator
VTIRLVVADDDDDYRLLLRLGLEGDEGVQIVGEVAKGADLAPLVVAERPDLVLIDRSLPGVVDALADLRRQAPDARLVLTSSLPPSRLAPEVAATGAVGSLAKDVPVRHLPDAIRELSALVAAADRALHSATSALPRDLASVRASRAVAREALEGWVDAEVSETAVLLMSELVTNGVRHAGSDVRIRVAVGADVVRVEVADRSPDLPVRRDPEPTEIGGRGMGLVDALSVRWGVQPQRTGKVVWFELPRR